MFDDISSLFPEIDIPDLNHNVVEPVVKSVEVPIFFCSGVDEFL